MKDDKRPLKIYALLLFSTYVIVDYWKRNDTTGLILLGSVLSIYLIYKTVTFCIFKHKYPIVSESLPEAIIKENDTLIIEGKKYLYKGTIISLPSTQSKIINESEATRLRLFGRYIYTDNFYKTESEDHPFHAYIREDYLLENITEVKNKFGTKWKKLNEQ